MAGAILGLLSGGAIRMLSDQHHQSEAQKQQHDQFLQKSYMDAVEQDPTVINNPEWVKGFKKHFGDGADDFLTMQKPRAAAKMREDASHQDMLRALQLMPGGSPTAAPTTPAPDTGAPATAPPAVSSTSSPAAPTAAPALSAAPSTAPSVAAAPVPSAAPAVGSFGAAPTHPDAIQEQIKLAENALVESGSWKYHTKEERAAFQRGIEERLKDLRAQTKEGGAKLSPDKEAFVQAFYGKPFAQLDQPTQQKAIVESQKFGENPLIDAFSRQQAAWQNHEDERQKSQENAQASKDRKSTLAHATSMRTSVSSWQQKADTQARLASGPNVTQDQREAVIANLNDEADAKEQEIRDAIAEGTLPHDFKMPKMSHYKVDAKSGGLMGFFQSPGTVRAEKPAASAPAATSPPAVSPGSISKSKSGKAIIQAADGTWHYLAD